MSLRNVVFLPESRDLGGLISCIREMEREMERERERERERQRERETETETETETDRQTECVCVTDKRPEEMGKCRV